jgi:hypothetical protein
MGYSGAGGKLFHEKNQKQKSRDTVPLTQRISKKSVDTGILIQLISRKLDGTGDSNPVDISRIS